MESGVCRADTPDSHAFSFLQQRDNSEPWQGGAMRSGSDSPELTRLLCRPPGVRVARETSKRPQQTPGSAQSARRDAQQVWQRPRPAALQGPQPKTHREAWFRNPEVLIIKSYRSHLSSQHSVSVRISILWKWNTSCVGSIWEKKVIWIKQATFTSDT